MNNLKELEICEGYKDSKGNQYYLDDLVFNPCFRDLWLVSKQVDKSSECPYCLKLWTDENEYVIDLDMPSGFIIECHKNEERYEELYNECLKVLEEHKKMGIL